MLEFSEFSNLVTNVLREDLKSKKISVLELSAATYLLSKADDAQELMSILVIFEDKYPSFHEALEQARSEDREKFEHNLKLLVPKVLQKDPVLAAKVVEFAQNKDIDMQDVVEEFPQVKEFLNL
jgi:hypothetical protein